MKLTRWKLVYIFLFIFLIFQTNMVLANNIVVPHEWYRYQGASDSDKKGNDCGPASVAMAIQFIKNTFVPIRDIRNYIGPNTATSEKLKTSLQHWGISYNHLSAGSQNVIDAVNNRKHIVICPVEMLCFSPGLDIDPESDDPALHYDRYCSFTEEHQGHFIVVKGISDDGNWIIVYDPGVWRSYPDPKYWYSNGEPKGKERYYKLSEFSNAINSRGIEILAEPHPIITSPLKITSDPPYYIGDIINAEFSITNKNTTPITFTVLTVGGRDPNNHVSDFTIRQNITLEPSEPYNYQGTLALNKVGDYHFFCTYQTPDGNWNTNVDLGSGLTSEDRTEDISVKEKTQSSISEELKISIPPEVIWSREFQEMFFRYIIQTPNEGYILVGDERNEDYIGLVKLDLSGHKLGESRLRYRYPWVTSLQKTSDGGYILLAMADEIEGTRVTMYLIKTDSSGHKIWDKRFNEKDLSKRDFDIVYYLIQYGFEGYSFAEQTPDGGYILAGAIYKNSKRYPWLMKINSKGDEQWEKIFFKEEGYVFSFEQTSDGGYILAGASSKDSKWQPWWLMKINSKGDKQWEKIFEGEERIRFVQQTSDGGYILAGNIYKNSKQQAWLMKINSKGDKQWEKIFEGEERIRFVQQTSDGGYILAGNSDNSIKLIKTDASGQKIWDWTKEAEHPDFKSFQQTSDGGYILLIDSQLIKLGNHEETQKEQVTEFFEEFKEEGEKEISPYHVKYKPIFDFSAYLLVNISGPADELGIILTNPEGWSTTRFISKRDLIDNFESVKVSLCKEENPPSGTYNLTIKTITPEKTVYQKEIKFSPPALEITDGEVRAIKTEGVYISKKSWDYYLTEFNFVVKNWGELPIILRKAVITIKGRKTQEIEWPLFEGVPYGETKIKEGGKRNFLRMLDEDIFDSAVIKLYSFSEEDCIAEYQARLRFDYYDSIWDYE